VVVVVVDVVDDVVDDDVDVDGDVVDVVDVDVVVGIVCPCPIGAPQAARATTDDPAKNFQRCFMTSPSASPPGAASSPRHAS
jgi:hypothetical protein